LSKIGGIKVRLHRPMLGQVKTCTIKREVNQWYVTFAGEVEEAPLPPCEDAVGIDLGLLHFATLSTGETIENPRLSRQGFKRPQAAATGQGPQAAWQPTPQTRRACAGKSPQTGAPPAQGFSAPGSANAGESLWPDRL